MKKSLLFICLSLCCMVSFDTTQAGIAGDPNTICGKWEVTEKNLIVLVYRDNEDYKAKIIWFSGEHGKPMEEWTDKHNPDESQRSRKILGMNVLTGLKYEASSNSWEDGMIYDAKHGRDWNASAYIDKQGMLRVKGYWHFKFIGKTLLFKRLQ